MLPRGAAAEVSSGDEDRAPLEARIVEGVRCRMLLAIVLESVLAQALEGYAAEIAGRNDPVRVDVIQQQRNGVSGNRLDFVHKRFRNRGGQKRTNETNVDRRPTGMDRAHGHAGTASRTSRTSVTQPSTAAAATIAGLIKSVRPVGLPWRPLKFRLLDEAQISRPTSLSGFMARHIEQPAPAPLESCLGKDAVEAFALGLLADLLRAGDDERADVRRDMPAADDPRGLAEVGNPRVGARADEGDVDLQAADRPVFLQLHEVERLGDSLLFLGGKRAHRRDLFADADRLTRVNPPGDGRLECGAVDDDVVVELGVWRGGQAQPPASRAVEGCPCGAKGRPRR